MEWIAAAYAQDGGGALGSGGWGALLPFVLVFVIFYFLLIRPQQKRMKQHREMIGAVRRGDVVVTAGGLIGKVVKVEDNELQVDLGEGMRVRVVRSTISEVRSRTEPAND
ncbi:MAG: preprotein translocase subunit YajC [Alphaproteobacteria bacterium]|nr:MAG: preprotein translocase subunit YajC [Alphaproteobacteria bacterium]